MCGGGVGGVKDSRNCPGMETEKQIETVDVISTNYTRLHHQRSIDNFSMTSLCSPQYAVCVHSGYVPVRWTRLLLSSEW